MMALEALEAEATVLPETPRQFAGAANTGGGGAGGGGTAAGDYLAEAGAGGSGIIILVYPDRCYAYVGSWQ